MLQNILILFLSNDIFFAVVLRVVAPHDMSWHIKSITLEAKSWYQTPNWKIRVVHRSSKYKIICLKMSTLYNNDFLFDYAVNLLKDAWSNSCLESNHGMRYEILNILFFFLNYCIYFISVGQRLIFLIKVRRFQKTRQNIF